MLMHFHRTFLVVLLTCTCFNTRLHARQQTEIPPEIPEPGVADSESAGAAEPDRVVEGRPNLYGVKKALHPFSWIEWGLRPAIQGVEKFAAGRLGPDAENKPPKVSGVKFSISGVGGTGSSSGLGVEVRPFHNDLFGTGTELEVPLGFTVRVYESYRFRLNYPLVRNDSFKRLGLELTGRYMSRPSESFYGIGNNSPHWAEARFRSVSRTAGIALDARFNDTWSLRVEEGYRSIGITKPRNHASVTDVFQGADVPGLSEPNSAMLTTTASLQRSTKDRTNLASSGGLQRIEASLNDALTGGDFSYWRYMAEVQQFIPLDDSKRKVIALRARLETTEEKGGSVIPFYDLPAIGGRQTVRGFASRRYTDKSAVSASLEYRYRIWRHVDWGFFVDTGKVAPEIGNFARSRFHTGYGIRFMVRAKGDRAVSIDVGHSHEALMFYVDFTPDF